jgi:hypothetical protein
VQVSAIGSEMQPQPPVEGLSRETGSQQSRFSMRWGGGGGGGFFVLGFLFWGFFLFKNLFSKIKIYNNKRLTPSPRSREACGRERRGG